MTHCWWKHVFFPFPSLFTRLVNDTAIKMERETFAERENYIWTEISHHQPSLALNSSSKVVNWRMLSRCSRFTAAEKLLYWRWKIHSIFGEQAIEPQGMKTKENRAEHVDENSTSNGCTRKIFMWINVVESCLEVMKFNFQQIEFCAFFMPYHSLLLVIPLFVLNRVNRSPQQNDKMCKLRPVEIDTLHHDTDTHWYMWTSF